MKERLVQVCLPGSTFGIVLDELSYCTEAAPIGKWMIGKHIADIIPWVSRNKGTMYEVKQGT